MKLLNLNPAKRTSLATTAVLAAGILSRLPCRLIAQPSSNVPPTGAVTNLIPLKLESSIPLAVRSAGVEWKGNTFHLVQLGSIRFDLDKSDRLTSEIQAGVMGFDDVDYDISGAVFDAAGQMLGSARAQCKVRRMWAGVVKTMAQTITLDFGVSLDYARAVAFVVSISNRKVLTPNEWQK
jgi:hypothetical protein